MARAKDFVASLGINTHAGFFIDGYQNSSLIVESLAYLGINTVRDALPLSGDAVPVLEAMARAGIKFDIVASAEVAALGASGISAFLGAIKELNAEKPGSVISVEGLNEVNLYDVSYNGKTAVAAGADFQRDLYTAVKADATLGKLKVLNLSIGLDSAEDYAALGDMGQYSDYANVHAYAATGAVSPKAMMQYSIDLAKAASSKDPLIVTETGYTTYEQAQYLGVDEETQAELTLSGLLASYKAGAQQTYLYQLFDTDSLGVGREASFGVFNDDGTPKLAAVAIHNFTTILNRGESTASKAAAAIKFKLTGSDSDLQYIVLQKSGGATTIVVWADRSAWDDTTDTPIKNANIAAKLSLSKSNTIRVYDPIEGTSALKTVKSSTLKLAVNDHPLVIEIGGKTAAAPKVSKATSTTLSEDTLLNSLSTLADNKYLKTIKLTGDGVIEVSSEATLTYLLKKYEKVFDKIAGTYKLEVSFGGDSWHKTLTFDRDGNHLYTVVNIESDDQVTANTIMRPDGTSEVTTYGITGKSYTKVCECFDANGKVTLIIRHHADGTLDSREEYRSDGSKLFVTYDPHGHKTDEVSIEADGDTMTTTLDPETGSLVRKVFATADGDTDTQLFANGSMTHRFVHQADGSGENYAFGITGKSYTSQYQRLNTDGAVVEVVRKHADGTLDYTETADEGGGKTLSYYDATGTLQTRAVIQADGSRVTSNYLSNGDVRHIHADGAGTQLFVDTVSSDGKHSVYANAAGQVLRGGAADDTFNFGTVANCHVVYDGGDDLVAGLITTHGTIHIGGAFADDFGDLMMTQVAGDVVITLGADDIIRVRGTTVAALTADYFDFG